MNQILQFLAGNAWLLIPIFIGVFNVAVRAKQKATEQKAKRDAHAEILRRKAELLRTGRAANEPVIVYDEATKRESPKTPAQQRKERIEALRQQRMDQLRAMREKRASTAGSASQARQAKAQSSPSTPPKRSVSPQRSMSPKLARSPKPNRPTVIPASSQRRNQPAASRSAAPIQVPPTKIEAPSTEPVSDVAAASLRDLRKNRPNRGGIQSAESQGSMQSARGMLRDRKQIRQAIVLREVLNAPVALREPDSGPGNLPF